jgi:hypothetical protein
VLSRDEERPARIAQSLQLLPDRAPEERVDARSRLVEKQNRRVVDERTGEFQASLHTAGEIAGPTVPHRPEVEKLENLANPAASLREEEAEQAGHEVDILGSGQLGIEQEALGHVSDLLTRRTPKSPGLLAQDPHLARRRSQDARQEANRSRLAGAARTDQSEDRSGGHVQTHAVERDGSVESPRDLAQLDRAFAFNRSSGRAPGRHGSITARTAGRAC